MCDYSSFSSIDKLRRRRRRRGAGAAGSPRRALPRSRRPDGTAGHSSNKEPKVNCFHTQWASVLSVYLPRRSGQIFAIKLEAVEHGCCTNIYISADHSLIAALGENNIAGSSPRFGGHKAGAIRDRLIPSDRSRGTVLPSAPPRHGSSPAKQMSIFCFMENRTRGCVLFWVFFQTGSSLSKCSQPIK